MNQPRANTTKRPALRELVAGVLADLAFMVEDELPPERRAGGRMLRSDVEYRGPLRGRVTCWCSTAFAAHLAANLLGVDLETGEARDAAEDALRELTSVLCGQLVVAWYGAEAGITHTIPTVAASSEQPPDDDANTTCRLAVQRELFICRHEGL